METTFKRCTGCGNEYPATHEYFHRHKQRPDGLYSQCKTCANHNRKQYYLANRDEVIARQRDYDQDHLEEKHERNRQWRMQHKAEISQRYSEYRRQNRDTLIAYLRAYYQENREHLNEQTREYYKRTRPARLKYAKRYRTEHGEQRAKFMRAYYRSNKERLLMHQRVRAMKKRAGPGITALDIERQYAAQQGLCYWCSCRLESGYHVDHVIPLIKGGVHAPSNIVVACAFCNQSKGGRLPNIEWHPLKPLENRPGSEIDKE